MFSTNKNFILCFSVLIFFINTTKAQNTPFTIVPQPQEMTLRPGVFELNNKVEIVASSECMSEVNLFVQWLNKSSGESFIVKKLEDWKYSGPYILFKSKSIETASPYIKDMPYLNPRYAQLVETQSHEGYTIMIEERGINITAENASGIFYATQSLRQSSRGSVSRGTCRK